MKCLLLLFLFIIQSAVCQTAFADIYKCISDDGILTFSDVPCGSDNQVIIKQGNSNIDVELKQKIKPFIRPYTIETYKKYINEQAQRIGRAIFPGQWLNYSEVVMIKGPYPNEDYKNKTPMRKKYGYKPGWLVLLRYGSKEDSDSKDIEFRFISSVKKDTDGISWSVVWLKSIHVDLNKTPFIPETMENIEHMKMIQTGRWDIR